MDTEVPLNSQLPSQFTAEQIYSVLEEFLQTFDQSSYVNEIDFVNSNENLIFELLEHTVDMYPSMFFQRDFSNTDSVSLMEFTIFKLISLSCNPPAQPIRTKIYKIITYILLMCKTRYYTIYRTLSGKLFSLFKELLTLKRTKANNYPLIFGDSATHSNLYVIFQNYDQIVYSITSVCGILASLLIKDSKLISLFIQPTWNIIKISLKFADIATISICLELKFACISNEFFPSNLLLSEAANLFVSNIGNLTLLNCSNPIDSACMHSVYQKFTLKIIDEAKIISNKIPINYLTIITQYLVLKFQNASPIFLDTLDIYLFQLVLTLLKNSNNPTNIDLTNQYLEIYENLKCNNLPIFILKQLAYLIGHTITDPISEFKKLMSDNTMPNAIYKLLFFIISIKFSYPKSLLFESLPFSDLNLKISDLLRYMINEKNSNKFPYFLNILEMILLSIFVFPQLKIPQDHITDELVNLLWNNYDLEKSTPLSESKNINEFLVYSLIYAVFNISTLSCSGYQRSSMNYIIKNTDDFPKFIIENFHILLSEYLQNQSKEFIINLIKITAELLPKALNSTHLINYLFIFLKSLHKKQASDENTETQLFNIFYNPQMTQHHIIKITPILLLNLKTETYIIQLLNNILKIPLINETDENIFNILLCYKAFIQFSFCNEVLFNFFSKFYDDSFNVFKEFRLQHRFVNILCKITEFTLNQSENLFNLSFLAIVKASFIFNRTLITVLSRQIHAIISSLRTTPNDLYHLHRDQINDLFSENAYNISKMAFNDKKKSDQLLVSITNFHLLFGESHKIIYLTYMLRNAVCYAVIKRSSELINLLASIKGLNNKEMLLNTCRYIFPELFIRCDQKEILESAKFLQMQMQVPLRDVIMAEFQEIVHQCFLCIGKYESDILRGLKMKINNEFSLLKISNMVNLGALFENRILGVLAFFNFILTSGDVYDKKRVILSIGKVITLAEEIRIDKFRLKTLALLRYAAKVAEELNMVPILLQSWFPFIENITDANLPSITPQIVSSVLHFVNIDVEKVFMIIHKLLVDKRIYTDRILGEIHLMSDSPRFNIIKDIFIQYTSKNSENKTFKNIILEFATQIGSDFIDVRKGAILNLSDFLIYQQKDVSALTVDNEGRSILSRLYNQLLFCCTDPQSECVIEAGRCLGVLGVLDYSLFDQFEQNYQKSKKNVLLPNIIEPYTPFCQSLLIELSNAFLFAGDTQQQDCAAFAIQEILKQYRCTPKNICQNPDDLARYLKFPQNIQEVLFAHISSRYKNMSQSSWSNLPLPLYGQRKASTHKEWIKLWGALLISLIPDGSLRASLLKPCLAIVRYDASISKFLLPYITVYIFEDSNTSNQKIILDECNHLLTLICNSNDLSEALIKSVEVVFDIFDFVASYVSLNKTKPKEEYVKTRNQLFKFIESFCYSKLSYASFLCRSYARALRYLEIFISRQADKPAALKSNLEYIQKIYCMLDDYDGILGVEKVLSNQLSLEAKVVEMESQGRFRDVIAYYEKHLMNPEKILISHSGILRSMLHLGQFQSVHSYCDSINTRSDITLHSAIINAHMEALWRLGSWAELDSLILNEKAENSIIDDSSIALTLSSLKSKNSANFINNLKSAYMTESKKLTYFGSESFPLKRCSQVISNLHSLFDIEMGGKILGIPFDLLTLNNNVKTISAIVFDKNSSNNLNDSLSKKNYFDSLAHRLNNTEVSYSIREPLLNLHRIMKDIVNPLDNSSESTNYWASCAKLARKCGYFETAFNYLLYAEKQSQFDLSFIKEKANFLMVQRSKHEALAFLRKSVLNNSNIAGKDTLIYAKIKLMSCRLMAETLDCEPTETMKAINETILLAKNLEKVHFVVGDYYEKLIKASGDPTKTYELFLSSVSNIILHYGTSLKYGYKYIYNSLPRLITLWIDLPSNLDVKNIHPNNRPKPKDPTSAQHQIKVNEKIVAVCGIISNFVKILPQFVFLCALPQLVSRICHQNDTIWEVLRTLLTKLLISFPQQVSWQMVGVAHSTFPLRVSKCRSIFDAAQRLDTSLVVFLNHLMSLTERLLEISNKKDSRANILLLSQNFPSLVTLIKDSNFSKIIIPSMQTLNCILPSLPSDKNHSLFINPLPFITSIKEEIKVFSSLQRPKKIEIISSTGEIYSLLCKPKDDLRRDGRLMEFNSLVNIFLGRHPQARKRNLRVRLFAVVPLNDECGIIEWVNNTVSLRSILLSLYAEINAGMTIEEIKRLYGLTMKDTNELYKLFTEKIMPAHPPVLHEYFFESFTDASSWYAARQLFTRSAAVMSMVGYILGLGDRHGENILLINTTGELVHVDFNCLFNKGLTFEWPEKVPFRLTHNMVETMGSLGYQSTFQSCSEIIMDIMRSKKDSLLGVLTTFLHDPLVEWVKQIKRNSNVAEQGNEKALKMLEDVEHRLMGIGSQSSFMMPLSVKGQVHQLIQEATNPKNLSQMYFGWASFH